LEDFAVEKTKVLALGIPQDLIDAAEQVGMDMESLVKLCVSHTTDAARSWLAWLRSKLGGKKLG
jgi:hypothetical protein